MRMMGIFTWLRDRDQAELDRFIRKEEAIDALPPHQHTAYYIGINTKALLDELRLIRWLLIGVIILLVYWLN